MLVCICISFGSYCFIVISHLMLYEVDFLFFDFIYHHFLFHLFSCIQFDFYSFYSYFFNLFCFIHFFVFGWLRVLLCNIFVLAISISWLRSRVSNISRVNLSWLEFFLVLSFIILFAWVLTFTVLFYFFLYEVILISCSSREFDMLTRVRYFYPF